MGLRRKHQKVGGRESYIVAIMYIAIRFILAWDVSSTKEGYDAVPLLRRARGHGGQDSPPVHYRRPGQYHIAFRSVFRTLKGPISIHIRDIHIRNLLCNTSKQERFHGELAGRYMVCRGINREHSLIFRMAILHRHSIKPHAGMAYRTPAEAPGIDVRGADRWRTLIQNAAAAT